ncbi:outer membrane receptor protein involved in Fe transport [Lacibacter cauensis]|uniref:Outer membrane receptor protein involved in Fe transport n=1 Tax=Lacibacter cauensis TaxID=510947 RepID=A0A562SJU0_9BACT|nr:TonB-dependent receptor plug domain-containing protein [Lacibacter cauensis]TWI81472.1 outer membrane receptor protein involved in Fe transport [Lacibacter cauensis]
MKNAFLLLVLFYLEASGQSLKKVSGVIEEFGSKERMNGATITALSNGSSVVANENGFFSIALQAGEVQKLIVTHTSYLQQEIAFYLQADTFLVIQLKPQEQEIANITIVAPKPFDLPGSISIPVKKLSKVPMLFGEKDLIKAIQLLPGVQSGREGSTGLYVRGGGADQNLILLDGVTIYNVSHLFGFLSLFPSDAVKTVDLIKGDFPARYGGRLSSVIDIKLRDGNKERHLVDYTIGLLSSKITIEGPIKKSKSSFIITARRSFADLLAKPFQQNNPNQLNYFFYDGIAKMNFLLPKKKSLSLSLYMGQDNFLNTTTEAQSDDNGTFTGNTKSLSGLVWGNTTVSLRYSAIKSSSLTIAHSLSYSLYNYKSTYSNQFKDVNGNEDLSKNFSFQFKSKVQEICWRSEADWYVSDNLQFKFGAGIRNNKYNPAGSLLRYSQSGVQQTDQQSAGEINTYEGFAFVEAQYKISKRVRTNTGVHINQYHVNNWQTFSFQPRINLRFLINPNQEIYSSFTYTMQPIHLLTNNGPGLPVDLWVPATKNIPPQYATQYSVGYKTKWKEDTYEISTDVYLKQMNGVIEYTDGASFVNSSSNWEKQVVTGLGKSYGAELFFQKKKGKFNGWAGYTLSWSRRKFEEINNGKWFWYKYDRRHDFKVVMMYEFSKRIDLAVNFALSSGNRMTLPDIQYLALAGVSNYPGFLYDVNATIILNASERNNFTFPIYHRADLSLNFHKQKKRGLRIWNISIYNIYSRANPFFYTLRESQSKGLVLTSVNLFPILPSVSYQFKFGAK